MTEKPSLDEILFEAVTPTELARREAKLDGVASKELAAARSVLPSIAAMSEPTNPSVALRARISASIGRAQTGRYTIFADRLARLFDLSLDDATELTKKIEDPSAYKPAPFAGIEMIAVRPGPRVKLAPNGISAVARLQVGVTFPMHRHFADEINLVLEGGFVDAPSGREIWRGDELFEAAGSEHAFTILPGVPCIAAAVAPLGIEVR